MLNRLRYLLLEGFEVRSISGYDSSSDRGEGRIIYVLKMEAGRPVLASETFEVTQEEMEQCSNLFLRGTI